MDVSDEGDVGAGADGGSLSIREALERASEAQSATEAPVAGEAATTAPEGAGEAVPAEAVDGSKDKPAAGERARDERGKFAKAKPAATAAPAAKDAKTTTAPPVAGATTATAAVEPKWKAPQSWKPLAREAWAKLPPEVQEEVARRESEVPRALQEAATARQFQAQVMEAVRPYEMIARAAGQHPVQYAVNLMQVAAQLQTGAPTQRAAIVAGIIRDYGIDVTQLAAALDGQPGAQGQPREHQPPMDPRAIVREELERAQKSALASRSTREVEGFVKAHEFAGDEEVRDLMASLIESAARRGVDLSMDDAYSRAVAAHPDYAKVMTQRQAAQAATTARAATERARAAGSSVRSDSAAAPNGAAQPKTIREALEAAADKLHGRV